MKVYVASSWRNYLHQSIVAALRAAGLDAYDYRAEGFRWAELDGGWLAWTPEQFRRNLQHPVAIRGFGRDWKAMQEADCCVLVLPCGRSAHLEAGWFVGQGRPLHVVMFDRSEPELMYRLATSICLTMDELFDSLDVPR